MLAKTASAVAAPSPVTNPESDHFAKLRRIQRIPIGPIGAAMENPIMAPSIITGICMGWGRD